MEVVTYNNIRSELKLGDVVFTRDSSIVSKTIRAATCSGVSHVGAVLWNTLLDTDRVICVESQAYGPQFTFMSDLLERYRKGHVFVARPMAAFSRTRFTANMINVHHSEYDWRGAGLSWLPWVLTKDNSSKFFCSELVACAMSKAGSLYRYVNASRVTPGDLLRWKIWAWIKEIRFLKGTGIELPDFNTLSVPYVNRGRWFWKTQVSLAQPLT